VYVRVYGHVGCLVARSPRRNTLEHKQSIAEIVYVQV
jgi:hypothetical protein